MSDKQNLLRASRLPLSFLRLIEIFRIHVWVRVKCDAICNNVIVPVALLEVFEETVIMPSQEL